MEPIDEVIARAMERGEKSSAAEPRAVGVKFDVARNRLALELAGGSSLASLLWGKPWSVPDYSVPIILAGSRQQVVGDAGGQGLAGAEQQLVR